MQYISFYIDESRITEINIVILFLDLIVGRLLFLKDARNKNYQKAAKTSQANY